SYRTYVDLERDYVTIAIFATPEFSLAPKQWCFPIFGCVPYRAHFSIDVARKEVNQLREEGYDVHVSGVTAYSTLGWSPDPLLNTMFTYGDTNAAAVVFHELAHQQLYVPSDAAFNEAFAVAVEIEGVSAWLRSQGDEKALLDYLAGLERRTDFVNLITETREELFQIYQSQKADAGKRAQKAEAIERFRARYRTVRDTKWNGFRGYDNWFDSEINNAKLGAAGLYNDLVPELRKLFDVCGRAFARFYEAAERLAKLGADARKAGLKSASSC
ncbi:MAG: aminopeptidase, partial [Pseudomonadota bacterium]